MNDVRRTAGAAVIIALGMVVSATFLSDFFLRIKHEKEITVKGYAEKNVVSDIGKFYCSYSTRLKTLKDVYGEIKRVKSVVVRYLRESGFSDDEIEIFNISTHEVYKKDHRGMSTNEIEFYRGSQGIRVTSKNVNLVRTVSRKITELIQEDINIYCNAPEFFVSNLDAVKVDLIARATENGYQRAKILAKRSGGKVGSLSAARQGVFQITTPNSTETSGYGHYDLTTIDKTVKAVVTLQYAIE